MAALQRGASCCLATRAQGPGPRAQVSGERRALGPGVQSLGGGGPPAAATASGRDSPESPGFGGPLRTDGAPGGKARQATRGAQELGHRRGPRRRGAAGVAGTRQGGLGVTDSRGRGTQSESRSIIMKKNSLP